MLQRSGLDDAPREERVLADLPPDNWPEARRRHAVLVRYMRKVSPTIDDAKRSAAAMGVTTRTLYRLVHSYKELRADLKRRQSRRGKHSVVRAEVDGIVAATIRDLGPTATDVAVHDEATRRCHAAGLTAVSHNSIRRRRARVSEPIDLARRLGLEFDLIVDCSRFTFDVVARGEPARPATLAAVFTGRSGELMAWNVFAGRPDVADLTALLEAAGTCRPDRTTPTLIVAAVSSARRELERSGDALAQNGLQLDRTPSIRLRDGAAIVPAIGLSIGRIPFAPMRKTEAGQDAPSIPLHLAREILARLIGKPATDLPPHSDPDQGAGISASPTVDEAHSAPDVIDTAIMQAAQVDD